MEPITAEEHRKILERQKKINNIKLDKFILSREFWNQKEELLSYLYNLELKLSVSVFTNKSLNRNDYIISNNLEKIKNVVILLKNKNLIEEYDSLLSYIKVREMLNDMSCLKRDLKLCRNYLNKIIPYIYLIE